MFRTARVIYTAVLFTLLIAATEGLFSQGVPGVAVDEAVWRPFIAWAETQPRDVLLGDRAIQSYRTHLIGSGRPTREIEPMLTALWRLIEHAHVGSLPQQKQWDELINNKYWESRPAGTVYPFPPSGFLERMIKSVRPGKSLDCGTGAGKDPIWLAQQGWDATAFDRTGAAVKLALENAQKAGVIIKAVHSTAEEFPWGENQFDLITNFHSLPHEDFLPQIRKALKPGGLYVTENGMLGSMADRAVLPGAAAPNQPLTWFTPGWRVLHYEEVPIPGKCARCSTTPRIYRLMMQKMEP